MLGGCVTGLHVIAVWAVCGVCRGLSELIEEFAVCDADGVALDEIFDFGAGKALIRVRGDFGGTLGGGISPSGGLRLAEPASSTGGGGPVFDGSKSGIGGARSGMSGTTNGARFKGRSMDEALR